MTEKIIIVDTPAALNDLARSLAKASVIACDLEADSMYHYREKVCLLQIATGKSTFVIDPLAVSVLDPLKPVFSDARITKVFHGADYDIRSLYRDFKITVNGLFDTELACRFLGMRATGLDAILQKTFNVNLDKKYQKRDWSKRPLPDAMLHYAARDSIYLAELSQVLIERLKSKKRLHWVTEECDILQGVRPAATDNRPLFCKFNGAGRLNRRKLAVLEALLIFRQQTARKKDKPLFKIIGNDALMRIVAASPTDMAALETSDVLSAKQMKMYGNKIVCIVSDALNTSPKDLPVYPRKRPPAVNPAIPVRIKALKTWRDNRAKQLRLTPSLLFSKSLLTAIATTRPIRYDQFDRIVDMRKWQKSEFGSEIVALLKKFP